jgi:hypothetical protein
MTAPLDPTQASATQIIDQQLQSWGLDSLTSTVSKLIREGWGSDAITLQLQQTPEYQQRFSANQARVKNGLAALSPADYIATENSYRQVMQQYGLPSGFYDQNSDFAGLIANDISPDEVKTRAQDAQAVWLQTDPAVKQAWSQMYGLSDGAAIASILDPGKALPIVQRMTTASQIGGAALTNGLQVNQQQDERMADLGVTQAQAQKGYGQIAQSFALDQQSAKRAGLAYSQADAENATILQQGAAMAKQRQIYDSEQAMFTGRGSADQNTQAVRTAGSY